MCDIYIYISVFRFCCTVYLQSYNSAIYIVLYVSLYKKILSTQNEKLPPFYTCNSIVMPSVYQS